MELCNVGKHRVRSCTTARSRWQKACFVEYMRGCLFNVKYVHFRASSIRLLHPFASLVCRSAAATYRLSQLAKCKMQIAVLYRLTELRPIWRWIDNATFEDRVVN